MGIKENVFHRQAMNRPYGLFWYRFKFEYDRTIFKRITCWIVLIVVLIVIT